MAEANCSILLYRSSNWSTSLLMSLISNLSAQTVHTSGYEMREAVLMYCIWQMQKNGL